MNKTVLEQLDERSKRYDRMTEQGFSDAILEVFVPAFIEEGKFDELIIELINEGRFDEEVENRSQFLECDKEAWSADRR